MAIYVVEDFGNPALIAGQYTVLPTLAYGLISGFGDFAGAAVVSTILLGLALSMYLVRIQLEGRHGYVTISGRGSSMPRPPVPPVGHLGLLHDLPAARRSDRCWSTACWC